MKVREALDKIFRGGQNKIVHCVFKKKNEYVVGYDFDFNNEEKILYIYFSFLCGHDGPPIDSKPVFWSCSSTSEARSVQKFIDKLDIAIKERVLDYDVVVRCDKREFSQITIEENWIKEI